MRNQTPVDNSQCIDDRDNEPHVRAVDGLVHELGISAEEVNRSYREVLEELKRNINAESFLPVLVSRVVKQRLLHNSNASCAEVR